MVVVKKRLLPLFLAFVVAVGCVAYRPQEVVYADAITLTGEGLEVLFGLLGATGVVVGVEETMEQRFIDAQKLFDSLPATQQQSYVDWLAAGEFVTSDTGHTVFYPDMTLDTSWYSDLWQSVHDVYSGYISYSGSISGFTEFDVSHLNSSFIEQLRLGSADCPIFYRRLIGGGSQGCALLPNGFFVAFSRSCDAENLHIDNCRFIGVDASISFRVAAYTSTSVSMYVCVLDSSGAVVAPEFYYPGGQTWFSQSAGFVFGGNSGLFGMNNVPAVTFDMTTGVFLGLNDLLDCDTWVSTWEDAVAADRQVGFVTGQDLSGYNTLEDFYNPETGLVTGLDVADVPVVPDVPVTGDLTGIAGGIQSLLDLLKALPATLSNAFLGDADLNFDALKNSGFTTKFPFCIPFDLYNCIAQLVASPVPPVFTLSFAGTVMESAGDIVIDMNKFETLAKILRYFIFFGFVLGLIKITRNLIKG